MRNQFAVLCLLVAVASSVCLVDATSPFVIEQPDDFYEIDPLFNQETRSIQPTDSLLNADLIFRCTKKYTFIQCLEHYLKKDEFEHLPGYTPFLPGLEDDANLVAADSKVFKNEKRSGNNMHFVELFKKAMSKNMKIKPSIKTARF